MNDLVKSLVLYGFPCKSDSTGNGKNNSFMRKTKNKKRWRTSHIMTCPFFPNFFKLVLFLIIFQLSFFIKHTLGLSLPAFFSQT